MGTDPIRLRRQHVDKGPKRGQWESRNPAPGPRGDVIGEGGASRRYSRRSSPTTVPSCASATGSDSALRLGRERHARWAQRRGMPYRSCPRSSLAQLEPTGHARPAWSFPFWLLHCDDAHSDRGDRPRFPRVASSRLFVRARSARIRASRDDSDGLPRVSERRPIRNQGPFECTVDVRPAASLGEVRTSTPWHGRKVRRPSSPASDFAMHGMPIPGARARCLPSVPHIVPVDRGRNAER